MQTEDFKGKDVTNCIYEPILLADKPHRKNKHILVRSEMSSFPGRRFRRALAFLRDRNAYSIPRTEELFRVDLSMYWIL
jgi:hypothetical protein